MSAALPAPCACAHAPALHLQGAGACIVTLPPFLEEELPAWSCPCTRYAPAAPPAGPWRWHARSDSWQLPREQAS